MKKYLAFIVAAVALTVLAASCNKAEQSPVQPVEAEQITIRASIPEGTKVAFTELESGGLHLAWEEGDCIIVSNGSQSQTYEIKDGFTDHEAEFTGPAISGESFTILYTNGDYNSLSEAQGFDFTSQVQNGNGNTDHLRYIAWLSGVNSYTEFTLSEAWASEHGGSFNVPGIINLEATLPAGVTKLKSVSLNLGGMEFTLGLKNVDVSASSQVLTAYAMIPWTGLQLPAKTPVDLIITGDDDSEYGMSFTLPSGADLKPGHVSRLLFPKGIELLLFAGGNGTEASPWLISKASHLVNLMNIYKADEAADKAVKYWAKLIADVDIKGVDWIPFNRANSYGRAIDFDGDGHTISNLTVGSTYEYPSFAGVVYGDIKNVTFESPVIDGGSKNCGVVGGYIGTGSNDGHCSNVTVNNAKVTVSTTGSKGRNGGGFAGVLGSAGSSISNCHVTGKSTVAQVSSVNGSSVGGFIGNIAAAATITGCTATADVSNDNSYYTGGFIGQIGSAVAANISSCAFLGGNITAGRNSIKNSPVAGFVGRVLKDAYATFTDCYVDGAVITATTSGRVAGFVGDASYNNTFTSCYVKNSSISGSWHCGGFAGVLYCSASKCYAESTTLTANGENVGGFVGYPENATINNCYAASSVTVDGGTFKAIGGFVGIEKAGTTVTNCYEASSVTGTGTGVGAFIGFVDATPTSVTSCIAWNNTLPFWGEVQVVESVPISTDTITGNYIGTSGTVTSQAQGLGWSTDVWDFSGSVPVLK